MESVFVFRLGILHVIFLASEGISGWPSNREKRENDRNLNAPGKPRASDHHRENRFERTDLSSKFINFAFYV